jgi:predicted Na+-dependent transporter
MLLSSFGISFSTLRLNLIDFKFLSLFLFLLFVLSPLVAYSLSFLFDPILATGLIIAAVTPAGVANAAYTTLARGKAEEALAFTIVSSFLSILVIPFVALLVLGKIWVINPLELFTKLAVLILIPLFLAKALEKRTQKLSKWIGKNPTISLIPIFFILWAVFSKSLPYFNIGLVLLFIFTFGLVAFLYLLGSFVSKKLKRDTRAGALSLGRRNLALIFMIAASLDEPIIALPAIMWAIGQISLTFFLIMKSK